MRTFFALEIDPDTALDIERWRRLCWPALERAVPVSNYHLTLAFLGEINHSTLEALHERANAIQVRQFDVKLDRLGFWSKPGVLWVGPHSVPPELLTLAKKIKGAAALSGIGAEHAEYEPHVTLKRRLREAPTAAMLDPDFTLQIREFHLMESKGSKSGVHYETRLSWPLLQAD